MTTVAGKLGIAFIAKLLDAVAEWLAASRARLAVVVVALLLSGATVVLAHESSLRVRFTDTDPIQGDLVEKKRSQYWCTASVGSTTIGPWLSSGGCNQWLFALRHWDLIRTGDAFRLIVGSAPVILTARPVMGEGAVEPETIVRDRPVYGLHAVIERPEGRFMRGMPRFIHEGNIVVAIENHDATGMSAQLKCVLPDGRTVAGGSVRVESASPGWVTCPAASVASSATVGLVLLTALDTQILQTSDSYKATVFEAADEYCAGEYLGVNPPSEGTLVDSLPRPPTCG